MRLNIYSTPWWLPSYLRILSENGIAEKSLLEVLQGATWSSYKAHASDDQKLYLKTVVDIEIG